MGLRQTGGKEGNSVIPALSYMIGAYIIFRGFEMWSLPDSHFDGKGSKVAMRLLAIALVAIASLMMYAISQSSETIPRLR